MNPFRIKQINTGQKFPHGIKLSAGECYQCARVGNVGLVRVRPPGFKADYERPMCAECIADFIVIPFCIVQAQTESGEWKRVATDFKGRGQ